MIRTVLNRLLCVALALLVLLGACVWDASTTTAITVTIETESLESLRDTRLIQLAAIDVAKHALRQR